MGAVLKIGRRRAILRDGVWRAADPKLESELNEALQQWIRETGGPPLDSVNPEREAVHEIMRRMGGQLLLEAPAPVHKNTRIWFALRQYRLWG